MMKLEKQKGSQMNTVIGSGLFLETLIDEGVRYLFGNPGTTELPLMDALVNEDRLDFILCLQESVAMGAAEGYALATGKVGVVSLHVAPGLGNAMGLLYNAKRSGAPVLVTAGNQPQSGHFQEIVLYEDLVRMVDPLAKWAYEIRRVEDLEQAVRRAVKVALTPPTGPVFLSLPGDLMLAPAEGPKGHPTRIDSRFTAPAESIRQAASLLAKAERPVFIAGSGVTRSGGEEELARLAEQIGAKVYEENFTNMIGFPLNHPLYMGKLPVLAKPHRARLKEADLLFLVGTEAFIFSYPPEVRPMPEHAKLVHLDLNAWEMGKNFPLDVAMFGDPRSTLPDLLEEVRNVQSEADLSRSLARRRAVEAEANEIRIHSTPSDDFGSEEHPEGMSLNSFHAALGKSIPKGTAVVEEALTSSGPGLRRALADKAAFLFGRKGGAVGNGLPMALGVKAAMPERPVVCISGDGSAMFSNQALWTAAKYHFGVVFVIANNGGYRILKERVLTLDGKSKMFHQFIGMDICDPALDFLKLAESMGVTAKRAKTPQALQEYLREALASGRPYLIDAFIRNKPLGGAPQEI